MNLFKNFELKNFLAWLFVFVPFIAISWSLEIFKKIYYVSFRIPHRKVSDKVHDSYDRIKK